MAASDGKVQQSLDATVLLAADVGGTHARIGLLRPQQDGRGPAAMLQYHRYACAEWSDLSSLLADFVERLEPRLRVERCAVASAGYVLDDAIVNENLPWPVSIAAIRQRLGLRQLVVVNDFQAVAYAARFLGPEDTIAVIETATPPRGGPVLVLGPGTGLGAAVLLPGQPHPTVLPTEAGQIALAPGNELEVEILRELARERSHVTYEDALSGPGLLNLYRAIASLRGTPATLDDPAVLTRAALGGTDPLAERALDVFCGLLGSFVGDLAMLYGASGGVFLAGGILPQIREVLLSSRFAERFFNKGVMRPFLEQIPVRLIDHGQLGVLGAAGLYLDGHAH